MQIIERCPIETGGILDVKQQYDGKLEVSYNSDGMLILRKILDNEGRMDVLICLTREETKLLANFIRSINPLTFN